MTVEHNEPNLPESFLRGWPGRFRYAELVRRLHGEEPDQDFPRCLLADISVGRSVDEVLEEFAEKGEFQLAETLLAESDAVSQQVRARLADLEPLRAERASELAAQLRTLTDEASASGVPFEVDAIDLEALARVSWPAVEALLSVHRDRIGQHIQRLRNDLTAQNHSGDGSPRLRAAVDSLITAGRFSLAQRMLDDGTSDLQVPEAQPTLPSWRWSECAAEVLSWHVDPTRPKPPEFSVWRAVDDTAHNLVEATEALGGGGPEAATEFAAALERFLDRDAPEPAVHEFSDGWLSTVSLFRHSPLSSFRATPAVDLLILPPGVQSAPTLPGVESYLAVGPDLQVGGGFRTGAAVLTVADILRLVTLPAARAIGVARIIGRQWPLSAFGVSTPTGLGRLLAEDLEHPWRLLGWLCDLVGAGGSATADDLQFQGGDDAPVLYTLLTNQVDALSLNVSAGTTSPAAPSPFRERGSIGVEGVVLRDCPDPSSRAAFWAALLAAPPGTPLALDSLVIAAVLSPVSDKADWESVLAAGFERLRTQWFVDQAGPNEVSVRPLGVLTGMRSLAERRLAECAQELAAPALDSRAASPELPRAWSAHRYALSANWADRRALQFEANRNPETDLITEPNALIEMASALSGSCDLAEVIGSLIELGRRYFSAAEFIVDVPERTLVAVPERVLLTVLYELLENALEAVDRGGKIALSARAENTDVLIDIFDDGPGLDSSVRPTAQVFRLGFSTRGEGRGVGLYLARRITDAVRGELDVADRSNGHPVFKGAHFTLILPGQEY